uniref:Uncharacterized protein n=1 Tax=Esox lucius TaxID=8010 RepID=A0A3P8ZPP8_ESOLU
MRAAVNTQLQVLLGVEGLGYGARQTNRQAQRTPALAHHQGGADVEGPDLSPAARQVGIDAQAVPTLPLPAGHRAVHEGRGNVVQLRLVHLVLDTLAPVLKDDGDLGGGETGFDFPRACSSSQLNARSIARTLHFTHRNIKK